MWYREALLCAQSIIVEPYTGLIMNWFCLTYCILPNTTAHSSLRFGSRYMTCKMTSVLVDSCPQEEGDMAQNS